MWSRIVKANESGSADTNGTVTPWLRNVARGDAERRPPYDATGVFDAAEIMRRAAQRAAALLREAERKSEQQLAAAAAEIERLEEETRRKGYEAGFAEGFAEGRAEGEAQARREASGLLESLSAAVQEIGELRRALLVEAADDAVKFAVLIAEKIVKQVLQDPEATARLAGELLQELREESRVVIYLPPEAVEHPETERIIAQRAGDAGVRWTLAADPSLAPGDVRIETEWGWVDGRGSVRWARLIRALEESVAHQTGNVDGR